MSNQRIADLMTPNPQCCTANEPVQAAARKMASGNFGAVPVVDAQTHRLLGIITDRDITCRIVAPGEDPTRTLIRAGMTPGVATLGPNASIHDCVRLMEERQVRRIPIVDDRGLLLGIVAQADLARAAAREHELEPELTEMVEEVSAPSRLYTAG